MKLTKIKNNPNNPRSVNKERFTKLYNSIKDFPKMMQLRPIITNEEGVILGGNMRLKAIKKIVKEAKKDPEIYKDFPELRALVLKNEIPDNWVKQADQLTDDEKRRFIIADNVGFGEWDWELLANEWDAVELENWGLEIPGFEVEEKETEEDNFNPSDDQKVFVEFGDLIEFETTDGRCHRLLCNDSTISTQVDKLLQKDRPVLMVTDPPYGVNYNPKWREGLEQKRKGTANGSIIQNDDKNDWSATYLNFNIPVLYVWFASNFAPEFGTSLKNCGYEIKYLIIWNKDNHVLGRGDYHWKHEPCFYCVKEGEPSNWQGSRKERTVWDIPVINSFANGANKKEWGLKGHGNQKPVECMARPIKNNSKEGDIIADPFCGSGTTIVAAHQLGRVCYAMEIDPKNCSIIIDRLKALDNEIIVKINGKVYEFEKEEAEKLPF